MHWCAAEVRIELTVHAVCVQSQLVFPDSRQVRGPNCFSHLCAAGQAQMSVFTLWIKFLLITLLSVVGEVLVCIPRARPLKHFLVSTR